MISRKDIIDKAVNDCYIEMYKWAQPSINLEEYINNPELRKESDNDKFYTRYYLSSDNIKYIVETYIKAYHIGRDWKDNIDLLLNYITSKDSVKDKYIPGKDGFPGHRGYEPIIPLQDITEDSEKVIDLINTCKDFIWLIINKSYKSNPILFLILESDNFTVNLFWAFFNFYWIYFAGH